MAAPTTDDETVLYTDAEARAHMNSLYSLATPRSSRRLGYWLLGSIGFVILMGFVPWQQSVIGRGQVTAFDPANRPQTLQNVIAGQIQHWYVQEGQLVRKGDTIISITEIKDEYFDPELMTRLQEQRQAQVDYILSTRNQIAFAGQQIIALRENLTLAQERTRNRIIQAKNRIRIDSGNYEAEKVQFELSRLQFARFKELFEKNGLISLTDLERRRQALQEREARLIATQNLLLNARNELLNTRIEFGTVTQDFQDRLARVEGDRASRIAVLADAEGKLSQLDNKLVNVRIRQNQYFVLAPQDGYVTRALKAGIGETIKEGEPIATIVPEQPDKAIEMYVLPMDLPLLRIGQHVRIEFDGWPALQFSGWSNVSVGTFGGKVQVVDFVTSNNGLYRVLVTPDVTDGEYWPEQVRLGSGAKGWAMLNFVPIWYEVWRQFNGFPPNPLEVPGTASGGKGSMDAKGDPGASYGGAKL